MPAYNIKGITVEIGGDTKNFNTALDELNRKVNSSATEIGKLNRLLKLDPTAGMAIMVNGPQLAGAGAAPVPTTKTINYNQTINVTSPDPVSPAETARATRVATRDLIFKIKG